MPQIEEHLDGNLCRCTGYRPIWDAARSLCDNAEELVKGPCGTPCRECPERDACEQDCNVEDKDKEQAQKQAEEKKDELGSASLVKSGCCSSSSKDKMAMKDTIISECNKKDTWLNQPTELFPKELLDESSSVCAELSKPLMVVDKSDEYEGGTGGTWFKPSTFVELLDLLKKYSATDGGGGGYKIVVGNTEVGIGKLCFDLFIWLFDRDAISCIC